MAEPFLACRNCGEPAGPDRLCRRCKDELRSAIMPERSFDDVDSQSRLDRLMTRVRDHARAASRKRRRSEVRLLLVIDRNGLLVGESRVDPPAEFGD